MPPRYFSGESARRMENIRGLRRTQAVRQVGRVIGSGAIGATQGAVAGSEWLAANPVHTYDRDRQRFYEALAAATPQMQMALERENQIQNRLLSRQVQALEAAERIMAEKGAAARTNAQVSLSQQTRIAQYEAENGARLLGRIDQGSPEAIRLREQLFLSQGLDPETAAIEARRGLSSRGGGGGGGSRTEATISHAYSRVDPTTVYGGRLTAGDVAALQTAVTSGQLSIRVPGDPNPISNPGDDNAVAGIIQRFGANMSEEEKVALFSQIRNKSPGEAQAALQGANDYTAAFTGSGEGDLPPAISARVANAAEQIMQTEAGAAGGVAVSDQGVTQGGGSMLSSGDIDARYLGMSDDEFTAAVGTLEEAEKTRLTDLRAAQYARANEAIAPLMERVTSNDAQGYQNLSDTINQIQQVAQAMNLNPEKLWERAREGSSLPAVSGLSWAQALSTSNEHTGQIIDDAMQNPIRAMERVRFAGVDDSQVRAASDEMMRTHETFRKETGRAAAETRAIVGVPEANTGAGERVNLTPEETAEIQRQAEEAEAQAQQEAEDEAFRQQGYTSIYGLEVPTSSLPDQDDLGGRVLFAWDLAEQYPAHPPLQQFIQDQMSSPEFAEWMSDRGYVGQPTKELFREFQREYRQVRRMNEIHNRRQRRLSRAAQDRLGLGEDASRAVGQAAAGEMPEEGAYTRGRTQQYRRDTGKEARRLSKNIRDVQRGRPTAEQRQEEARDAQAGAPREVQPTLAQRIAQRQQQRQQSSPTPPRARLEIGEEELLRVPDRRQG